MARTLADLEREVEESFEVPMAIHLKSLVMYDSLTSVIRIPIKRPGRRHESLTQHTMNIALVRLTIMKACLQLTLVLAPETAARATKDCPFPLKKAAGIGHNSGKAAEPVEGASPPVAICKDVRISPGPGENLIGEALPPEGALQPPVSLRDTS